MDFAAAPLLVVNLPIACASAINSCATQRPNGRVVRSCGVETSADVCAVPRMVGSICAPTRASSLFRRVAAGCRETTGVQSCERCALAHMGCHRATERDANTRVARTPIHLCSVPLVAQ